MTISAENNALSGLGGRMSLKTRFDHLDGDRYSFLKRARDCSQYTLPFLLPPEGHVAEDALYKPYQSVGARGINNLSSKLLLTLFPPNVPFFKLVPDELMVDGLVSVAEDVAPGSSEEIVREQERTLSSLEKHIMDTVNAKAHRVKLFTALRHLAATGNTLIYVNDELKLKVFRLDKYVVKRDPEGNVLEIIVREQVSPKLLPESIRLKIEATGNESTKEQKVDVYTGIILSEDGSKYEVWQEAADTIVPDSEGDYKRDELPWLALRWTAIDGEDYGRGIAEEYLGDLRSLEGITKLILEGSSAAARVVFLVDPNGTTEIRDLSKAPNGGFVAGRKDDIQCLTLDKFHDFNVAAQEAEVLRQSLSSAFLLNSSVRRNAERVTAEEIREVAKELEDTLGGVYSVLSQELQYALLQLIIRQLEGTAGFPSGLMKDGVVKPVIVTGLEALGRNHDAMRILSFLDSVKVIPGAEQVLNAGPLIAKLAVAFGVDTEGLLKSPQQLQQEQMQAMAQSVAPGVAQEATKGIVNANQPQAQGQGPAAPAG